MQRVNCIENIYSWLESSAEIPETTLPVWRLMFFVIQTLVVVVELFLMDALHPGTTAVLVILP